MEQKRQKQARKEKRKISQNKDNKKSLKIQLTPNQLSPQEIQTIKTQMVQSFLLRELQKTKCNKNILPIDEQIRQNIIKGIIAVSQSPKNIKQLIRSSEEQTLLKITTHQMELFEKEAKRIQHLKLIKNFNNQLVNRQPQQQIPYILSREQHERKVRAVIQQKRQRNKRMQQIKLALQEKKQRQEKEAEQKKQQEKQQQKEKKRFQIEQKITRQKEEHIHFLSSSIMQKKKLQELTKKVPLHAILEEQFKKNVEMPELEQRKQQLKELRQFKKRYSVDCIKQHQKQYMETSKVRLQQSKMRRLSSLSQILQNSPKIPQKSERLKGILAEEIQNMKKQWKQRQAYIEEKIKRQQNYLKKLRQQHKPKIDKEKQEEILRRLVKEKQHLSKVGLQIDRKKIGFDYLSEVKKQVKKIKEENNLETAGSLTLKQKNKQQFTQPELKRSRTQKTVLSINSYSQFFTKLRENELSKILNSAQQPDTKISKLKIESQKIQEAKQRKLGVLKNNFNEEISKQVSNLALNSLKAKINLIDLMKNKTNFQKQSQY